MYDELINALRHCTDETVEMCPPCPYFAWDKQKDNDGCMGEMMRDAADAIDVADKRIAGLESNNPIVESVLVDKLNQRIDELENEKTNLEADIINLEIALDKAHCELVRCKDCKHYDGKWCLLLDMVNSDMGDWFCAYGERKDGERDGRTD